MKVIETIKEMQELSKKHKSEGKVISVVPTMGYLHKGHLRLIEKAREISDIVITTVFVNPTQFAPDEDFEAYPRNFERDSKLAESGGTDYIFHPSVNEMYPMGFSTAVVMSGITKKFEGKSRPNHFAGVTTVVAKLFHATVADKAIFGQKDFQQCLVIKKMVKDLNFPTEIIISPTVREQDGLAMSSRNKYLSEEDRKNAGILFRALEKAREEIEKGEYQRKIINAHMIKTLRTVPSIKIDYSLSADAETFEEPEVFPAGREIVLLIAAYLGKTRLIDNMLVRIPQNLGDNSGKFVEGL